MKFEIVSSDFVIVDNKVWFVPMDYLFLCCYNPLTHKNEIQIRLPEPENYNYKKGYFEHLIYDDRKIIGIPYWADYFFVYDIDSNELQTARFNSYMDDHCGFGFYATWIYNKKIVSFFRSLHLDPLRGVKIAKYSIGDDSAVLESMDSRFSFNECNPFDIAFRREAVQTETSLYLLMGPSGQIVEYSKDEEISVYNMEPKGCGYTTIAQIGDNTFCLSTNKSELIIWSKSQGLIRKSNISIDDFGYIEGYNITSFSELFGFSVVFQNKVYLFPYFANKVIEYDYKEDVIKEAFFSANVCCDDEEVLTDDSNYCCGQFAQPHLSENILYLWNIWSGLFYTVNLISGETKKDDMYIEFEDNEFKNDFSVFIKQENPILERKGNAFLSLKGFIQGIV